jgi:hypothetical protein
MKVDPKIAALSVGHLQLKEGHARHVTAVFETIGELVEVVAGRRQAPPWTGTTAVHIDRVIRSLLSATAEKGMNAWDVFRKSRPRLAASRAIFFTSPVFERIDKSVREGALTKLHLRERAINALSAINVLTIEALILRARVGIVELRAAGTLTSLEIVDALDALADSIELNGKLNWITYAQQRGFAVLPSTLQQDYSAREFLRLFPSMCEFAVRSKFGAAGLFIFRKRLLRHPDICISLREIGKHMGQSAERIRLFEEQILKILSEAIWKEEYKGCRFRLRSDSLEPLYRLKNVLSRIGSGPFPIANWRRGLHDCWALTPEDLGDQETLLLRLLGLKTVLSTNVSMIFPGSQPKPRFRAAVSEIKRLLVRRSREWVAADEVWQFLQKKFGELAPERSAVVTLLRSMPALEENVGRYRVKFEHLPRGSDRYERILRERGTAMHYREIALETDRRAESLGPQVLARSVAVRLAGCRRFAAVGKTGLWVLREWKHVETGTVADVAAEILSASETPLTEKALFAIISPRRPVRLNSIATLLREDPRFHRVAPCTWALKESKASAQVRRLLRRDRVRMTSTQVSSKIRQRSSSTAAG